MSQVHTSDHPLVKHKLTMLRDMKTEHKKFRELVHEITILLAYEATRDLPLRKVTITSPMGQANGWALKEKIGLIPVLRAGLGMAEAVLQMIPSAEVWHIGLFRDEETLRPVEYYNKLPVTPTVDLCLVIDPMLATGGSAVAVVDILKEWGARRIAFMGIIAAPEGVARLSEKHPDVPIYVAAVDEYLNDSGFIVPGLGDAGDRQFGTG